MNSADLTGIIGVGLILGAYFLSVIKVISPDSKLFYGINFIGAGLAGLASLMIAYWPFVILEGVWALVSLYALIRKFAHT